MVSRQILLAVAIMVSLASPAIAQEKQSAARLVTQFAYATDPMDRAVAFDNARKALSQEHAVTSATVDSIAKSLVQVAIRDRHRAGDAIALLASSVEPGARVPYPGVFARLREIVDQAAHPGISGAALTAMADLPDKRQTIPYVASFLEGKKSVRPSREFQAIQLLASQFGPEGRAMLKRIDEAGTVQDIEARDWLRSLKDNGYSLPTR